MDLHPLLGEDDRSIPSAVHQAFVSPSNPRKQPEVFPMMAISIRCRIPCTPSCTGTYVARLNLPDKGYFGSRYETWSEIPCPSKQYCLRSVECTRAANPASESGRAIEMGGCTGDAICKVQKIAPTMSLADSLAVHAIENRADENAWQTGSSTWGLESFRLHRRYDPTLQRPGCSTSKQTQTAASVQVCLADQSVNSSLDRL